jgi:hypothetical protein
MKDTTAEVATAGIWGLHVSSYLMASIPYLQVASLVLAILVSLFTLKKLMRSDDKK